MVAGDQSRERVMGSVCTCCETVGMGAKHQIAWTNGVPAQVFEQPVARHTVMDNTFCNVGLKGVGKGKAPSREELVGHL
jgi:hypothetical protein